MPDENDSVGYETYKTPTERLKNEIIKLLFENISHNAKSRIDNNEKFAFCAKTKDLSLLLEKFTPHSKRKELLEWYAQLNIQINDIKQSKDHTITMDKKEEKILDLQYKYALEVHMHNERVLLNSPIIEAEVEGELDISNEDVLDIIRLRSPRTDDRKLEFKH